MPSEFEFIRRLTEKLSAGEGVVLGPGDDAAAIQANAFSDKLLLQTTDLLVEEVDFRRGWATPYQIGMKALAVNLSDIAAMGGQPCHALLSLAIPERWSIREILALRRGFLKLARRYGVSLIGGDLSASLGPLFISVTVNGEVETELLLRRSGARPGDVIWVSRSLGEAAAALRLLQAGARTIPLIWRRAFCQPEPEIELGKLCAESRGVSALIDVSDGLAGDLGHVLRASRVGARLFPERFPVSITLQRIAERRGWEVNDLILQGGEDFCLLGCSPKDQFPELQRLTAAKLQRQLFAIGEIAAAPGLKMRDQDGRLVKLTPKSFDHFAKRAD